MANDLTQKQLKDILHYCSETGVFVWISNISSVVKINSIAGHAFTCATNNKKYHRIVIGGKNYLSHRLAWFYMTGEWPKDQIDHEDGNGLNNKWNNLREVTNAENARNQRKRCTNKSGVMGVYWNKTLSKWHAQIMFQGKKMHLGYFKKLSDAAKARKEAEVKYDFHPNHGSIRGL